MFYRRWITLLAGLALLIGSAFAAAAPDDDENADSGALTVTESVTLDVAADEVWSVVRDFDALSLWHPGVEGSDITQGQNNQVGAHRRLTLDDGSTIDEALIAYDDAHRRYSYRLLDGLPPVKNYRATIAVEPLGEERSRLVWKGRFDAAQDHGEAEARQAVRDVYRAGLDKVRTMLTGDR